MDVKDRNVRLKPPGYLERFGRFIHLGGNVTVPPQQPRQHVGCKMLVIDDQYSMASFFSAFAVHGHAYCPFIAGQDLIARSHLREN
jgi:hypothetical protein